MNAIPLINNAPRPNINVGSIGSPAFNPVAAGAKLGGSIGGNVMRQNPASMPVNNETQLRQEVNTSIVALKREAFSLENLIAQAAQTLQDINKRLSELEGKQGDYVKKADATVASVGGDGKYISAISETDGKISATESEITSSVSSGNSQPVTSGGVAEAIDHIIYNANITDCNDAFEKGKTKTYWVDGRQVRNCPPSSASGTQGWYIISQCNGVNISQRNYITQIATPADYTDLDGIFVRHCYLTNMSVPNVWGNWTKVILNSDVDNTIAGKIKTRGETIIDKVYEKLDGSNIYLKNGMNQIAQNIANYTTGQFVDINTGGPRYCFVIYKLDNTYWSAELRSYQSAYNNIVFKFGHENTGYFGVKIY